MADDVRVRPFFFSSVAYLALAALWGAARVAVRDPVPLYGFWVLVAGFMLLLLEGLAYWYFKSFTKRRVVAPAAAWGVLGFTHAAVLAPLALVPVAGPQARAVVLGVALAGAALGFAAQLLLSALLGGTWRSGGPMYGREGPHGRGDAFAAAAFAVGLLGLAGAGALGLLVERPADLVPVLLALLLLGLFPLLAGWTGFLLPRNAKRALPAPRVAWGALVLGAAGALGVVAGTLGADPSATLAPPSGLLLLAGTLGLGAFWLFLPYAPDRPGPLLGRARPYFAAAGGLTALGGLFAMLGLNGVPSALKAALPLLALGAAGGTAGVSLLGLPVLANQRPGPRGRGVGSSFALGASGAGFVAWALADVSGGPALALAALSAGLYAWQISSLRKPRRACPP